MGKIRHRQMEDQGVSRVEDATSDHESQNEPGNRRHDPLEDRREDRRFQKSHSILHDMAGAFQAAPVQFFRRIGPSGKRVGHHDKRGVPDDQSADRGNPLLGEAQRRDVVVHSVESVHEMVQHAVEIAVEGMKNFLLAEHFRDLGAAMPIQAVRPALHLSGKEKLREHGDLPGPDVEHLPGRVGHPPNEQWHEADRCHDRRRVLVDIEIAQNARRTDQSHRRHTHQGQQGNLNKSGDRVGDGPDPESGRRDQTGMDLHARCARPLTVSGRLSVGVLFVGHGCGFSAFGGIVDLRPQNIIARVRFHDP